MSARPKTPRAAALHVLTEVLTSHAYANIALKKHINTLDESDKRLCTEIVYGTLENLYPIDAVIGYFTKDKRLHTIVRNILRLSVYQILYLQRIPDYSVCDEAVKLARQNGKGALSGFVNAVLRNITRQPGVLAWLEEGLPAAQRLSLRYSYPAWLSQYYIDTLGEQQAAALMAYTEHNAAVCVRTNRLAGMDIQLLKKYFEKQGVETRAARYMPDALYVMHMGDITQDPYFLEGRYAVMGEASIIAADVCNARPDMRVLDACCAPGGKSACLAQAMQNTGTLEAWDIRANRVELTQLNLTRLHVKNTRCRVQDATIYNERAAEKFDVVFVDAPCSGLGVAHNKPEIKYRRTLKDIQALQAIQKKILNTCAHYVRPGGALIYATCTTHHLENTQVAAEFAAQQPAFQADDIAPYLPEALRLRAQGNQIQLWPQRDGLDGFFIARFRRSGKG